MRDEGYINLAEAILRFYIKDIKAALKCKGEYRDKKLERLRKEGEFGALSSILSITGLEFDGIVEYLERSL